MSSISIVSILCPIGIFSILIALSIPAPAVNNPLLKSDGAESVVLLRYLSPSYTGQCKCHLFSDQHAFCH